jgi:hypothetical protein
MFSYEKAPFMNLGEERNSVHTKEIDKREMKR